MNQIYQKLEKKFGKYAVPHLTYVLIGCYVVGYLLQTALPTVAQYMCLDTYAILHGEIWRLITWVVIPPSRLNLFTVIMLFFYLSIGTSLERAWGDFRYNLYLFGGMLISVIAAFAGYVIFLAAGFPGPIIGAWTGNQAFSTYYICMSLLLAYAATFPDAVVLLMFVIPVPMKYLGIIYGAFIAYDVITLIRAAGNGGNFLLFWLNVIAVLASLLNFAIFFLSSRQKFHLTKEQKKRQQEFRRSVRQAGGAQGRTAAGTSSQGRAQGQTGKVTPVKPYRHRCTVCGRTDLSDPDMEFRYCSKCSGAHEYCSEHLYTHVHIRSDQETDSTRENTDRSGVFKE